MEVSTFLDGGWGRQLPGNERWEAAMRQEAGTSLSRPSAPIDQSTGSASEEEVEQDRGCVPRRRSSEHLEVVQMALGAHHGLLA